MSTMTMGKPSVQPGFIKTKEPTGELPRERERPVVPVQPPRRDLQQCRGLHWTKQGVYGLELLACRSRGSAQEMREELGEQTSPEGLYFAEEGRDDLLRESRDLLWMLDEIPKFRGHREDQEGDDLGILSRARELAQ